MHKMIQAIANLPEASSYEALRPPAFKTPSIKAPDCFDRTQPFKVRSFIQFCNIIFHNNQENFSEDKKKSSLGTSFLIGRAEKWNEPSLSNMTNQDPNYLLNSWALFESQLSTLFWDPNEVGKSEVELDGLRMKEGGHVSLYIDDFRCLVSQIGDCGERALIHHFRKGLASRIPDQLASHCSTIDSLQELMDFTMELEPHTMSGKRRSLNPQSQFLPILKILQVQITRRRRILIFRKGKSPILPCIIRNSI
ncbi:hypothetical protein O181_022208 [Austropuccinia psidii MF-1]|uniref:Retrotransposon gag domain-containing protein n=1 Tax=Austropuccinia psidii MF-1 TaxID=1389203 RepID=A0A9Q3CER8_9BASI|nr:hypothetical protein [Austropuccinia psidii MF-1]